MRKMVTGLMMILVLAAFGAATAEAAATATIDVTVTITAGAVDVSLNNTSWAIGFISEIDPSPSTGTGGYFTATNNRNAPEDLTIKVANSVGWSVGDPANTDQFEMQFSTDGTNWTAIDTVGVLLADNLGSGDNEAFDLKLLQPTDTTVGGVMQTIVVTVTAQVV